MAVQFCFGGFDVVKRLCSIVQEKEFLVPKFILVKNAIQA